MMLPESKESHGFNRGSMSINQTCTTGELLVQVTNSTSIPFKEKYNLLLQLKGKLGLA